MNSTALVTQSMSEVAESVFIGGDLSKLSASERVIYYTRVCASVGLNPLTKPFEYLNLNGKLTLYARRDATDQLRTIHGISLSKPSIEFRDDLIIVTIDAVNRQGRTDADYGVVGCKGLQGEAKANAIMKAITKAKRRVTLSIAGLGWLDETEVDSVPNVQRVHVDASTGEIIEPRHPEQNFGMGDGDAPADDVPGKILASQSQLNKMHALGMQFHGDKDAWNAARPTWVSKASGGKVTSSKELSPEQADWIIYALDKRLGEKAMGEMAAQEQPELEPAF